ncbi:hypothetical protein ACFQPA_01530 [Halomarina halobia]|uniref:YcaO domain-containing protein n=1 Tax=Halomarina halobia TaxID=3033386 RepID=A0ABD6A7M7_9EURY|nr:hypothetical protein [Halomarina sp. PSR21]
MTEGYRRWRRAAAATNLAERAAVRYYRPEGDGRLYAVAVDGAERTYPLVARRGWLAGRSGVSGVLGPYRDAKRTAIDESVVAALRARHADRSGGDAELWNGETYAVSAMDADGPPFPVTRSDYFSGCSTAVGLGEELTRALYDAGASPDAPDDALGGIVDALSLPRRERRFPDAASFFRADLPPNVLGAGLLPVFDTGDGHATLCYRRSADVAHYPGRVGIGASGIVAPDSAGEPPSVRRALLTEFAEELFDAEGGARDPLAHESVTRLERLAERGEAHLDFAAAACNAVGGNVLLCALLFVESPAYYRDVRDGLSMNWEGSDAEWVSLTDGDRLAELSAPRGIVPHGALCLFEGLRRLDDAYGVRSGLSFERRTP